MVDTLPVSPPLKVTLEFSGGAELLFEKQKSIEAELPPLKKYLPECEKQNWTMRELLQWIEAYYLRDRPELFLQGESVRPGLLVLINESDWELYDELEYEIKDNDTITFISTLHGG